jgi:hypothetical protein
VTERFSTVPALAGLCSYEEAARSNGTVEDTVQLARRIARIERRTLLVLAAHLNEVPEWEVKCGLALHLWQDAEHCAWMRERVTELRKPPHFLDRPDDPALEAFFDELIRSRSTRELLTGVYHVLKPSVVEAADDHLATANPLADQPTFRLLHFLRLEETEQIGWGERALAALGGADAEWERHLTAYLAAAGEAGGRGNRDGDLPDPRASQPLKLARVPARDERFTRVWNSRGRMPGYDAVPEEVNWRMLYIRLTEMHAVELLALTLYDWPDASFEIERDLARHLWDETRHAMLGEVAFETRGVDWHSVPQELTFASFPNSALEPRERYALLYHSEHAVMGKGGKRGDNQFAGKPDQHAAAQAAGDALSTLFHDYDWADEVLHVHIARRVLAQAYETTKERDEAGARARAAYDRIADADRMERPDWWSAFYAGVQSSP